MRLPAPDIPYDTGPEQTRVHLTTLGGDEVVFIRVEADIRHRLMGIFWKAARIGERLSPYISLCCVFMAVGCPSSLPFPSRFPPASSLLLLLLYLFVWTSSPSRSLTLQASGLRLHRQLSLPRARSFA